MSRSGFQDIQNALYDYFAGNEDKRIFCFLYVLSKESPYLYELLERRFKHKQSLLEISKEMHVADERTIQKRLQSCFIRLRLYL